jgi:hypothetical protein
MPQRYSLAKQTVTVHQHLDGNISIRFGPHVGGRYDSSGQPLVSEKQSKRRGKDGNVETVENQKQVSHRSHTPLEISQTTRDSHFSTAPATVPLIKSKTKTKKEAA